MHAQINNQSKVPWKTLVLSGCILTTYVPLRLERSESASKMVIICTCIWLLFTEFDTDTCSLPRLPADW